MLEVIIRGEINSGKSTLAALIKDTLEAYKLKVSMSQDDIDDLPHTYTTILIGKDVFISTENVARKIA